LQKGRKRTLIVVRRVLTEPKTVLAGVMLEVFSASFEDSMAAFSAEMLPSRPVGFRSSVSIAAAAREPYGLKAARKESGPESNRDERRFWHDTPRAGESQRWRLISLASVNVKNTFFFTYLNLLSIICQLFVII